MAEDGGSEKIAAVLRYWLEHDSGHLHETRKWAALARESGFPGVADEFEGVEFDTIRRSEKLRELLHRIEGGEGRAGAGHGTAHARPDAGERRGHGGHAHPDAGEQGAPSGHVHPGHAGPDAGWSHLHLHLHPIGVIRTPYPKGTPWRDMQEDRGECTIELDPELAPGLRLLDRFRFIIVLFSFHHALDTVSLVAHPPFAEGLEVGVFASRSPHRPNHLGMAVTPLKSMTDNRIVTGRIDAYDGTPLLDIKPYIERSAPVPGAGNGWIDLLQPSPGNPETRIENEAENNDN